MQRLMTLKLSITLSLLVSNNGSNWNYHQNKVKLEKIISELTVTATV